MKCGWARSLILPGFTLLGMVASLFFIHSMEHTLHDGWVRFALTGQADTIAEWGASSVLESDYFWEVSRYGPEKALDGKTDTAWVEGAPGAGIGESYVLGFSHMPEALGFHNGYAASQDLFLWNHRVRTLNVQVFAAVNIGGFATEVVTFYDARSVTETRAIELADTRDAQRVPLPFDRNELRSAMEGVRTSGSVASMSFPQADELGLEPNDTVPLQFRYIVRLEITDVYRGNRWEDTCIAEIWPDYGTIASAKVSTDRRHLVAVTENGEEIPGYADIDYVLSLIETSPDAQWALVIREPAYPGSGRISSEYALIHTPTGRDMTTTVFEPTGRVLDHLLPYGFEQTGSQNFVLYEDVSTGETGRARCISPYSVRL